MPKFLSVYEERAASTRFCERATLFRETAVWRCFINNKHVFFKFRKIHKKTSVPESLQNFSV